MPTKIKFSDNIYNIILPFVGTIIVLSIFWFSYQTFFGAKKNKNPITQNNDNPLIANFTPTPNPTTDVSIPSADIDSDNDGLSDALETIYKTDPNNPDTDSDGYKDGSEVANGYDPTIPSPNDKIDRLSTRIVQIGTTPTPSPTLTEQFINKTGIQPSGTNLTTNDSQLNAFINETNARGILPIILDSDINVTSATGKTAIIKYLDTLSISTNPKIKAVTPEQITTAFSELTGKNDSTALNKVIGDLKNNTQIFRNVAVPKDAVEIHKKYLGAVVALQTNTEALKNYQTDYVSVLVAASRIEGLRQVFTEVGSDIKNLEKKYNIQ